MTKKEICQILKIDNGTLKNWERDRPQLHEIVISHFQENKKMNIDVNNPEHMIKEIIDDLKGSSPKQIKIIYHCLKMTLEEIID